MLFVLRHGETEWNRLGRFQGQQNSPLTTRGQAQAAAMGRLLREHLSDVADTPIWRSPLGRVRETCALVCSELGIDEQNVLEHDALKEVNFGEWEGLSPTEVARRDRAAYDLRNADKYRNSAPGGESYHEVFARVSAWLEQVERGRQTVVIAHGSLNRLLIAAATGLSPQRCIEEVPLPQDAILVAEPGNWEVVATDFVDDPFF